VTQIPGDAELPVSQNGRFSLPWRRWLEAINAGLNSVVSSTSAIATALGSPDGTVANIPPQSTSDLELRGRNGVNVDGRLGVTPTYVELRPIEDSEAGTFKLLTRDDYGRLAGTVDGTAADVPYDNTASGLAATDVQAAIDEVAGGASLPAVMARISLRC
jgi:hypothetical protein